VSGPGGSSESAASRRLLLRLAAATPALAADRLALGQPADTAGAARPAGDSGRRPIRVGQIGVGHAHASKLSVYRASADYEVVGICEEDPVLRGRAESQAAYRGLTWMTRDELLGQPGLEAVLVETRVRDALEAAEACVAVGKHVHLDKPAGESLPRFRRILETASSRGLILQMGYMYRYSPAVILLREFLERGWLGEIFEVHAVMSKVVPPAERKALAAYRGGILFELGCHVMDLVVGILGRPTRVTGVARHSGPPTDDLVDNMLAVLEYPRTIATVNSTALEVEGFARRHLVVCGTEGTFHIQPLDAPAARVALSAPREWNGPVGGGPRSFKAGLQEVRFPPFHRYVADAADMAAVIRGEKPFAFPPEHDLAVQETLLAACGLPTDA
jgi:predicted dehydrogenase